MTVMRRYFFILLLCSSSMMAQDINFDFQAFRKGMLENYSEYRENVLSDYAKYLQGVWDKYEEFKGDKRDKNPKPEIIPQIENIPKSPQILPQPDSKPFNKPTITPQQPTAPTPYVPITPSSSATKTIYFYGMKIMVATCKVYHLESFGNKDIAKTWENYANDKAMKNIIQSLSTIAKQYGLNDWFTFELIRTYSEALTHNTEERIVLQHFLLVYMGYDIRIANSGTELLLLVPFCQQVYERNYLIIDSRKYYIFHSNPYEHSANSNAIYTCRLPQKQNIGKTLDLTIRYKSLGIKSNTTHNFNVTDGSINLIGTVDIGTMEAIRHYPQIDIPYYAMSKVIPYLHQELLTQMRMQIQGLTEREAVSKILHFIQYAFKYATDEEQHGYEKPYFIEENFYYPKNDCEDRATLFAFFVHNLLGLDVHLIHYPGHECTAVSFSTPLATGDYYTYKGKEFYICDPTYIGANIGQCMPKFKHVKPIVEQWY